MNKLATTRSKAALYFINKKRAVVCILFKVDLCKLSSGILSKAHKKNKLTSDETAATMAGHVTRSLKT